MRAAHLRGMLDNVALLGNESAYWWDSMQDCCLLQVPIHHVAPIAVSMQLLLDSEDRLKVERKPDPIYGVRGP